MLFHDKVDAEAQLVRQHWRIEAAAPLGGSSTHPSSWRWQGRRAGPGFLVKVFKVFSLDKIQERFVDQILPVDDNGNDNNNNPAMADPLVVGESANFKKLFKSSVCDTGQQNDEVANVSMAASSTVTSGGGGGGGSGGFILRVGRVGGASSPGFGRPCDPACRVPAVQDVRLDGAPDSVHRQSALTSCCATETFTPQCKLRRRR